MSQLYRVSDADDLIQRELDSMTLIYHRKSGITHMVADPVPAILEIMGEKAVSPEGIAADLQKAFEIEQGDDFVDIIYARLDELCQLGLIEQVSQ